MDLLTITSLGLSIGGTFFVFYLIITKYLPVLLGDNGIYNYYRETDDKSEKILSLFIIFGFPIMMIVLLIIFNLPLYLSLN